MFYCMFYFTCDRFLMAGYCKFIAECASEKHNRSVLINVLMTTWTAPRFWVMKMSGSRSRAERTKICIPSPFSLTLANTAELQQIYCLWPVTYKPWPLTYNPGITDPEHEECERRETDFMLGWNEQRMIESGYHYSSDNAMSALRLDHWSVTGHLVNQWSYIRTIVEHRQ